ncbi:MAG TPA: choice-of-anchor tandem repeat GloVer-containing protein [Acetobacteraceae bacterium]|nr:choice-of-anchor tandem repeat GloVer-containing protein [Acetobacteraceae bacterium]
MTATLTTLASFNGINGSAPGDLITDANGDLFGTTISGGASGNGTVFELAKTATGYASAPITLASFNGIDGANPVGGLITDANGNLFGTTGGGGAGGNGTVFKLAKTATGYASTPTTLASFYGINGDSPVGSLTADANGDLFGVTADGGGNGTGPAYSGYGTAFELAKTATGYAGMPTMLASFKRFDGSTPVAGLIIDADGNLLGTTMAGGPGDIGTAFEIAKTDAGYASSPTTLASFNYTYGAFPQASLITDANGDLFGTTNGGGPSGTGTAFEIAKTDAGYASTPTTLASFNGTNGFPAAGLIADAIGNLFGTTHGFMYATLGDASGNGTVFEVAKTDSGYSSTPITLASFNGANGAWPDAGLTADANGNLFGTTPRGGAGGDGTVFEITDSGFIPPEADSPGEPTRSTGPDGGNLEGSPATDPNNDIISVFEALARGSAPSGTNAPEPVNAGTFDVRDLNFGINYTASSFSNAFTDAAAPNDSLIVTALHPGAFIQTEAGNDILTAQAGGDNVLDDSGGSANFELGGAGRDAYFLDASHDPVSWNTIISLHSGDFVAIFGIGPQDVAANAADGLGAPGYTGLTLRMTSQSGGSAYVTLPGYATDSLMDGSLVTAFGTDAADGLERNYMLIQAT